MHGCLPIVFIIWHGMTFYLEYFVCAMRVVSGACVWVLCFGSQADLVPMQSQVGIVSQP